MRMPFQCLCVTLTFVIASAARAQLSVVSTTREVQAHTWGTSLGTPFDGGDMQASSSLAGLFAQDVSSTGLSNTTRAVQTSSVTPSQISGSGWIDLDHFGGGGSQTVINLAARVRLEVVFAVSAPIEVLYTASSMPLMGTSTANGFGTSLGLVGQFPLAFKTVPNGPYTSSFSGTLTPGTYRLLAFAECTNTSTQPVGTLDWTFDVSLTVVPAPGVMAPLGLAGAFAACRRRRCTV